jgi:hypothetical protein
MKDVSVEVLGLVAWTDRDKRGSPIAGVRPLIEMQKEEWREIDATQEFPTQGQVFWPNANTAAEGSLIIFRAEEHVGQKDEYKVVRPRPAYEVLDLRSYGTPADVRVRLAAGISLPGPTGAVRVLAWCKPDLLVGPVEMNRVATGTAKLIATNLNRLAAYTGPQVRTVLVGRATRLLRVDDSAPSGYVDWDDDAAVLRRALETAARVSKQAGRDTGTTTRQLDEAVGALTALGVGQDAQLDCYRLERARELLKDTAVVVRHAGEITEILLEHPSIQTKLDELAAKVRADVEQSARAELDLRLARERAALQETTDVHAQAQSLLDARQQELREAEQRLTSVRDQFANAVKEVETAVDARVLAAVERPLNLLAEVSVLRPLLGAGGGRAATSAATVDTRPRVDWSRSSGESIKDVASLRRALTIAARARGVDPSLMLHIHATVAAGLTPVTLGPSALAALAAYAHGACGGRLLIIHVSPSALLPRDLDEAPGGGLAAAVDAARDIDGISLVALEGANRSPLEGSVVPLLQMEDIGLSPLASARGLRLAATLVTGATTVPVSSQLWSYAAAIYADPGSPSAQSASSPGDLSLSSELLAPGDVPTELVDALVESWPDCRELRPALARLGAAFTRLYDKEKEAQRITEALLHGLVLPHVATTLSAEEQVEALTTAKDVDDAFAKALRLLRRRLC